MFPRLGSSVAQLSVVPVRWMHPQEVSHLDTHTAPGYIQTVGTVCVCSTRTFYSMTNRIFMVDDNDVYCGVPFFSLFLSLSPSTISHFASPPYLPGPHRLWECMSLPDEDVYGEIMQQADASALRLFEALVVTLPQTLLQTYVLICTDIGIKSPGTQGLHRECKRNSTCNLQLPSALQSSIMNLLFSCPDHNFTVLVRFHHSHCVVFILVSVVSD